MIAPCARCGRPLINGARCPACQCSRCGKAVQREKWGVCSACDAADIALAESGGTKEIGERLAALHVVIDAGRRSCRRCRGFGAVELSSTTGQVVATCICDDGRVRGERGAEVVTNGDRRMREVKQGNIIATEHRSMFTQRVCNGWVPYAKVTERFAKEFGVSQVEAERTIDLYIDKGILVVRDPETDGKSESLFDCDEFNAKKKRVGGRK